MTTPRFFGIMIISTALLVTALSAPVQTAEKNFTLARAIPDDVLLYVAGRHNPERKIIDGYWQEVFEEVKQTGIGDDFVGLIGSLLGKEDMAEVERIKERASQLLDGVDWEQLSGREMVFAERLAQLELGSGPSMLMNMVGIFRGAGEGTAHNFEGLVAILHAIVEEVNKAAGDQVLNVERRSINGTQVATVNLLAALPQAPPLSLAVAYREDLLLIALGDQLFSDVLGLLGGDSDKRSLAANPRFQAAFAQLPAAKDSMQFFDMQALMKQLRELTDMLVVEIGSPPDVYHNTNMGAEARQLSNQALAAYQRGDIKEALRLIKQAHAVAKTNSIVLYNLSCFNALAGNKKQALNWLEKAVEAGFLAPGKIASDSDLNSLRDHPRYQAALAKASKMARKCCTEDVITNSTNTGETYKLRMQAWQVYKQQDYEQGLKLCQQAYEVAPKDSRVLYCIACFQALLGHEDRALKYLEKAVDGGFYCPGHISKDPDLESLRQTKRYSAVIAQAKEKAAEITAQKAAEKLAMVKGLRDRLMNAVGILDYIASVQSTEGYDVHAESIIALVPDAKDRPIYAVFGNRNQLSKFERFLPRETVSFSLSNGIDLGALYGYLEDTLRNAGSKGEELLAKWTDVQTELGLDIKQDVIGWIDGESISVTLEGGRGWVFLIKVTDEQIAREKVTGALELLTTKFSEAVAKMPMLGVLIVRRSPLQHEKLEGFENLYLAMSPKPVVWGVADGHLILGTSADAVELCLDTAQGRHPNIRDNERVMAEALLPAGPFTSVKLTDRRNLGEELATGLGIASMLSGMASMAIPEPKAKTVFAKVAGMVAKLTPAARKIDFYKSAAACTTFDGHAWHTRGVTHYMTPAERASRKPKPEPAPSSPKAVEGL